MPVRRKRAALSQSARTGSRRNWQRTCGLRAIREVACNKPWHAIAWRLIRRAVSFDILRGDPVRNDYVRIVVLVVASWCGLRAAAAPFVNLNFEQATVPPGTPPGVYPAALAFPGWTPRIGGTAVSTVYYNYSGIGEAALAIYDQGFGGIGPVLEGTYSAGLVTDFGFGTIASLSQFGDVPSDAQSLRLLTPQFRPPPVATLNGIAVPFVRLSPPGTFNDPAVYGAAMSTFAGATVELRLSSGASLGFFGGLDDVRFSPVPIPEPQVLAILLTILASILRRKR